MKVTNITAGPKGIHGKDGAHSWIEPGAFADVEIDAKDVNKEWFATGDKAAKDAALSDPPQA